MKTRNVTATNIFAAGTGGALLAFGVIILYVLVRLYVVDKQTADIDGLAVGLGIVAIVAGFLLLGTLWKIYAVDGHDHDVPSNIAEAVDSVRKNYGFLQEQTSYGIVLSGTLMALGVLVIVAGCLGEMLGSSKATGNLSTVAGVVIEVAAGFGLYLFRKSFNRLNQTFDRLHELGTLQAEFREIKKLPDKEKTKAVDELIDRWV